MSIEYLHCPVLFDVFVYRTSELIWTQILQGLGGGFASSASQVGAQASVPHIDVAMVTASTLLFTEIGGAVGSAMGMYFPSFALR